MEGQSSSPSERFKENIRCQLSGAICEIFPSLAGVSLWPGSESISPMTLQARRMITTQQKMVQLVRYITMAGTVIGDPVTANRSPQPQVCDEDDNEGDDDDGWCFI